MKYLIMMSMALLLSACAATPQKLRHSEPVFQSSSSMSPSAVASCITEKWENLDYLVYSPMVTFHKSSLGYEVMQYLDGELVHLADIEKTETGSHVKVYTESLILWTDPAVKSLMGCELQN
ncbi:hypothetical protein [Vibrio sp. CAU 1672]|uniref:hypothetical protein n=1 Tax=Vibrio sp. CAU 1672 TaxID=3032594 RepID=UPI0023D9B6BE|nr:hypothetical protein [Vibrio sp. CAU 1672]MDF2156120.1 hypothetical protein [Vibrio sp. CAU 1672]